MVRPAGFEPATPRLGIWCSIQLSYERMLRLIARNWCAKIPSDEVSNLRAHEIVNY